VHLGLGIGGMAVSESTDVVGAERPAPALTSGPEVSVERLVSFLPVQTRL